MFQAFQLLHTILEFILAWVGSTQRVTRNLQHRAFILPTCRKTELNIILSKQVLARKIGANRPPRASFGVNMGGIDAASHEESEDRSEND